MQVEPWAIGALPYDCETCGAIRWLAYPFVGECCDRPLRHGGDSPCARWYTHVVSSVMEETREAIIEAVRKAGGS